VCTFCWCNCVEVVADDTKAIDAVLKADKKRLALLDECKKLEKDRGKYGDQQGDRLKEVPILANCLMNHLCATIVNLNSLCEHCKYCLLLSEAHSS
jgi:hypothetical protein